MEVALAMQRTTLVQNVLLASVSVKSTEKHGIDEL